MPDTPSQGCVFDPPFRPDLPAHDFAGGNTWVRDTVLDLFPDDAFYIVEQNLVDGQAASIDMLERAATMELTQDGSHLGVRIYNESGHKLPSGYPEGRRMWLNVRFVDDTETLIDEFGFYDVLLAELTGEDTKVYEIELGLDAAAAALTGEPEGVSFHFAINNKVCKDNRIPPRGFTNAAFEAIQSQPVAYSYDDGQYWDDTDYAMPMDAVSATVTLYYQTTAKAYVEFLRDENITDTRGDILYDAWVSAGKSAPVPMVTAKIALDPFATGDSDGDGDVDLVDFGAFQLCFTGPGGGAGVGCDLFDFDFDLDIDLVDFGAFQLVFTGPGA